MTSMVDQGSSPLSSPLTVQDKGQRDKRKSRMDPSLSDQNNGVQSHSEYPISNFSIEKSSSDLYTYPHCTFGDKINIDIYPNSDRSHWTVSAEAQLENLVLKSLLMIFKLAIFKISSYGYDEEKATKSVLRLGICNGCKDTASNIIDNAVKFLENGKYVNSSRQHLFEDLQQLNKYVLAEMIFVLKKSQPRLSRGDAMWCLLVCEMNTSDACAMATNSLGGLDTKETRSSSSISRLKHDTVSSTSASASFSEFTGCKPNRLNSSSHYSQFASQSQMPPVTGIPNLPSLEPSSSSKSNAELSECSTTKEHQPALSKFMVDDFNYNTASESCVPEEKALNGEKRYGGSSIRESNPHHRSAHLEKNYRSYKSKETPRAGIHESSGCFLPDKKCKCTSDFSGTIVKSATIQKNESVGSEEFQADQNTACPFSADGSASVELSLKALRSSLPLSTKKIEITPSIPSTNVNASTSNSFAEYIDYLGIMFEKMDREVVPCDKRDEMMLNHLVNRETELKVQLQEWIEWTQKKVMQAASRLNKDNNELKTLRLKKDEVSRLKKDKQALEENTVKKIVEMESALSKINCQLENANGDKLILDIEKARLMQEREAAELRDVESAAKYQEIFKRKLNTQKKIESREQEKTVFQEDLLAEKCKFSEMQKQVELAKSHLDQLEGKRRQEAQVKHDILLQAFSERKQREQMMASAKLKEDAIILEGEKNLQRHRDQIQMLETQATQLRLKTGVSKVGALAWSLNSSYAHCTSDGNISAFTNSTDSIPVILDSHESKHGDVDSKMKCIMCLTEEISVVFLPCAHQVVCNNCNELHQKQGMKDCPSCRSPIQRRILVFHLDSKLL